MTQQRPSTDDAGSIRVPRDGDVLSQFRAFRASRDITLRDRLVCAHLHLVHSVTRRFSGLGESQDDLIQEGTIGLLNAVDLFDPERGIKFNTYASHLITGQIQHYLRDRGRLIRQPAWVQELNAKVTRVTEQLTHEMGHEPSAAEVAARLQLPEDSIHHVLATRSLNRTLSLSAPTDSNSESTEGTVEAEPKRAHNLAKLGLPVEDRIVLEEAVNALKPLEQQVIRYFFFGDLSQSEIARKMSISVNYASYLLRRGSTKFKTTLETQRLQEATALLAQDALPTAPPSNAPIYDTATGTYSGSYLRIRMSEEIARSRRYPTNFALMLAAVTLDCDAEHEAALLTAVGQYLKSRIRTVDLLAYLGDHRFAFLLPQTGREARILGERLCQQVAARGNWPVPVHGVSLRVSFAVFPVDGTTVERLFWCSEHTLAAQSHS